MAYAEEGRWDRAARSGELALASARSLGDPALEALAAQALGATALFRGRLDDAEHSLTNALQLADAHGLARNGVVTLTLAAQLAARRGDASAEALALEVEAKAQALNMPLQVAIAQSLAGLARAREGDSHEAEARLRTALESLQRMGATRALAEARLWAVEARLLIGPRDEASRLLDRTRLYAQEVRSVVLGRWISDLEHQLRQVGGGPIRNADLESLIELAVATSTLEDLPTLLDRIARLGMELLDGERGFVLTGDPPEVVASCVREGTAMGRPSSNVVERAVRSRRQILAIDMGERGDLRGLESVARFELGSVLCAPLIHRGHLLGVLYVDSREAIGRDPWSVQGLLRGLAALSAIAIANTRYFTDRLARERQAAELAERRRSETTFRRLADELAGKNRELERLNHQLAASALTDPLTGAWNRSHLDQIMTDLERRATGTHGLLILGLDPFKSINDRLDRQAGDVVLTTVAGVLRGTLRDDDLLFRYSDEEFLALAIDTPTEALQPLAERLKKLIEGHDIHLEDGEIIQVTTSVGATTYRPEDGTWKDALQRADEALIRSKSGGGVRSR
jgi:diguanylate cyclase (GGDEF)-like protein